MGGVGCPFKGLFRAKGVCEERESEREEGYPDLGEKEREKNILK